MLRPRRDAGATSGSEGSGAAVEHSLNFSRTYPLNRYLLTMIALVVYSVLEWRLRQRTPGRKRPWTGRAALEVFESLLVGLTCFADGSRLWHPPPLTENQALLWEALDLPPLLDWLNNNCGT